MMFVKGSLILLSLVSTVLAAPRAGLQKRCATHIECLREREAKAAANPAIAWPNLLIKKAGSSATIDTSSALATSISSSSSESSSASASLTVSPTSVAEPTSSVSSSSSPSSSQSSTDSATTSSSESSTSSTTTSSSSSASPVPSTVYSNTCPYTLTNGPEGSVRYVILQGKASPFNTANIRSVTPADNIAQCADLCGLDASCSSAVFFLSPSGFRCTTTNAVVGPSSDFGDSVSSTPEGIAQGAAIIKDGGFCSEYNETPCCESLRSQ